MTDSSKTGGLQGVDFIAPGPFLLTAGGLALFVNAVGGPQELQFPDAYTYPSILGRLSGLALWVLFVMARKRSIAPALFAGFSLLPWLSAFFLSIQDMREMDRMVSDFLLHTQKGKNIIGTGLGEQTSVLALGLWLSACLFLACALGWAWAARKSDEHRRRYVPRLLLCSALFHFALSQFVLGLSWTFMSSGTLDPEQAQRWAALGAAKYTLWEKGVLVALLLLVAELLVQISKSLKRPPGQRGLTSLLVLATVLALSVGLGVVSLREGIRVADRYDIPSHP